MTAGFAVRRAGANDIPVLAYHRVAMFRDMGTIAAHLEAPLRDQTAAYFRDALPRGDYLAWVAEAASRPASIVGGAGVQVRPILPRPPDAGDALELGPEALVLNVYVEREWRRRGIAGALMRTLLDDLAARGIRRIILHASPEGRRLYERLGFAQTNEMRLTAATRSES